MLELVVYGTLLMIAWMTLLWWVHLRLHNAGIVDFGWATGLVMLAALYAAMGPGYALRKTLILAMVAIWGLRLAGHLLFDRIIGKPEDPRYATLRESWQKNLKFKLFLFFQIQGALDVLLSLPFLFMCFDPAPVLRAGEWIGLGVWALSLTGEWVADRQLKTFKGIPQYRGKVCQEGLWNYSRHPNYFFEWLIWIAYVIAAWGSPYGPASVLSPLLMLYFLYKLTGIPATEAQALRTKGDAYRRYQQTTSAFVPWFKSRAAA
jgi:steroid 5-alpha reductase family enzyme